MPILPISGLPSDTAPVLADKIPLLKVSTGVASQSTLDTVLGLTLSEGQMRNGRIAVSVASNNLTVALKTLAGTDPSATDPVKVMIGGVVRSITYALSVIVNAGASYLNMGSAELATKEVDPFVYLSWAAGTSYCNILVSRIPYANLFSDFNGTNTNEKGVLYNGSIGVTATDVVVNIGRFAATLSAGAGYTWSVPTFTASNLIQKPCYENRGNGYNCVITWDGTPPSGSPTRNEMYKITGNICEVWIFNYGYTAGTTNHLITATLPFTPARLQQAVGQVVASNEPNLTEVFVDPSISKFVIYATSVSTTQIRLYARYQI